MEVVNTNVAEQSDGTVKVEFNGEGGESIVVQMAAAGHFEEAAALQRAKELMVQVATFGIAVEQFTDTAATLETSDIRTEGLEETAPASEKFASPNSVS